MDGWVIRNGGKFRRYIPRGDVQAIALLKYPFVRRAVKHNILNGWFGRLSRFFLIFIHENSVEMSLESQVKILQNDQQDEPNEWSAENSNHSEDHSNWHFSNTNLVQEIQFLCFSL